MINAKEVKELTIKEIYSDLDVADELAKIEESIFKGIKNKEFHILYNGSISNKARLILENSNYIVNRYFDKDGLIYYTIKWGNDTVYNYYQRS